MYFVNMYGNLPINLLTDLFKIALSFFTFIHFFHCMHNEQIVYFRLCVFSKKLILHDFRLSQIKSAEPRELQKFLAGRKAISLLDSTHR